MWVSAACPFAVLLSLVGLGKLAVLLALDVHATLALGWLNAPNPNGATCGLKLLRRQLQRTWHCLLARPAETLNPSQPTMPWRGAGRQPRFRKI